MVLWEITLLTAYCLGLKRTYRLVLRLQRRLLAKHPRIRAFVFRRARGVFDVALRVHRAVQQRDIDAGKSVGNRILRFLDRLRPQANIRPRHPPDDKLDGHPGKNQSSNTSSSSSTGSSNSSSSASGGGGGSKVHFSPVPSPLHVQNAGSVALSCDLHASPPPPLRRSLPHILLDDFWTPLKAKLELSQRHRGFSSSCFSHYTPSSKRN